MSMHNEPCFGHHCIGLKDQLAVLLLLTANLTGETIEDIDRYTADHRGMSETQRYEHVIGSFSDVQLAAITPEALACVKCYSEQRMLEMLWYLFGILVEVP